MYNNRLLKPLLTLLLIALAPPEGAQCADRRLQQISAPRRLGLPTTSNPAVIAIVDDGLLSSSELLLPFLWRSSSEIPGNGLDDDKNGYVDDVLGWDVADQDPSVVHQNERNVHGTHLAEVIVSLVKKAYGEKASDFVKLLPVKAIRDDANRPYLTHGYQGIEYALSHRPTVILCAWGVGHLKPLEAELLNKAESQGTLVVASAGNFSSEEPQYPAAFETVLSVSAIGEDGVKLDSSNFGYFVDILAPGYALRGHSQSIAGTSAAAALVAGGAALLSLTRPDNTPAMTRAALLQTASPVLKQNPRLSGRLGAGLLNIESAVKWTPSYKAEKVAVSRPHGYLSPGISSQRRYQFKPEGDVYEIELSLENLGEPIAGGEITIWRGETPAGSFSPKSFPSKFSLGRGLSTVTFLLDKKLGNPPLLRHRTIHKKRGSRYCSGTKTVTSPGTISDGSGEDPYEERSHCKWLIVAPKGKVPEVSFTSFDTEPKNDLVYLFDGTGTHEQILAILSGNSKPPRVVGRREELLLWFVTDEVNQAPGWEAQVRFIPRP